jgi:hypothetical protein
MIMMMIMIATLLLFVFDLILFYLLILCLLLDLKKHLTLLYLVLESGNKILVKLLKKNECCLLKSLNPAADQDIEIILIN